MRLLYATAVFLASSLLFMLEPMAGKWLVPQLGGSAAVWTTCLVFFQTALLIGYLCAHWLSTRLPLRSQAVAYGSLLLAAMAQTLAVLRFGLRALPVHPILNVIGLLGALIGLPFVALSVTSPLLQSWYAREQQRAHGQLAPPYRLFALSNLGSLLALLSYPSLIEPRAGLRAQFLTWSVGFAALIALCAAIIRRHHRSADIGDPSPTDRGGPGHDVAQRPVMATRALWLLLAACGSLLLSAVTSHLSQDIAAIPLLWVLPLVAYLATFVLAFQGGSFYQRSRLAVMGLLAILSSAAGYLLRDQQVGVPGFLAGWVPSFNAPQFAVPFYCALLFVACLFCHGELYGRRPAPQHATSFYLSIAAGGALGAFLPGVVAPLVLSSNPELGCGLVAVSMLALAAVWRRGAGWQLVWTITCLVLVAAVALRWYSFRRDTIFQERNFYGTLRVTQVRARDGLGPESRTLCHGAIIHGNQHFAEDQRTTPTTYFSHDSGIGIALDWCCPGRSRRVGVIGLGAGTLAAYGRQGDVFRFYEINALVERVARNLFTYLKDSSATIEIVPGDARVSLAAEPPQGYDVLAVDAFSGDAIPAHLLTREAMEVYRRHLRPDGILAVHVTNHFLNLAPLVRTHAMQAGLSAVMVSSREDDDKGQYASDWVLVTTDGAFLAHPRVQRAAQPIDPIAGLRPWTDDYDSLLPLLKSPERSE